MQKKCIPVTRQKKESKVTVDENYLWPLLRIPYLQMSPNTVSAVASERLATSVTVTLSIILLFLMRL